MVTNLCFGLTCLLVPVLIELFNLQAALHLTNMGHSIAEVLIVCGIYWLFLQILRLDEVLYLRNLTQQKLLPEAAGQKTGREAITRPIPQVETPKARQIQEHPSHRARLNFKNLLKNHRTTKTL